MENLGRRQLLAVLLVAVAGLALVGISGIPLGVPGEWTWLRLPLRPAGFVLASAQAGAAGFLYLLVTALGLRFLKTNSRRAARGVWLLALVSAAWIWVAQVQRVSTPDYANSRSLWVLYDPGSSGYFFEARFKIDSVSDFLAGYEDLMRQQDVLHIGTHPPGLFLLHRAVLDASGQVPAIQTLAEWTISPEAERAFVALERTVRVSPLLLSRQDRAALSLAVWLTEVAAVLTVIPLFLWTSRWTSVTTAWRTAAVWPLIPAVSVFLPKSDVLYPLLSATVLALAYGGASTDRRILLGLAGVVAALGMVFSLAFLPVVAMAVGIGMFCGPADGGGERRRAVQRSGWVLVGLAMGTASASLLLRLNLLTVWMWNFRNHAAFYDAFERTWWKWLLVNPLELLMALGPVVVVWASVGIRGSVRHPQRSVRHLCLVILSVWGLLWLSGKNQGEAARLWILLMPAAVALSARPYDGESAPRRDRTIAWCIGLLAVQMIFQAAVTARVAGFHFIEPLAG